MQEQAWDVFFAAFSAPHCIGHHFYHGVEPTHPRYDEAVKQGFADTIEQVYRGIDHEIGEMLALVDQETRCMVFAAHGMGPLCHASWNLPEILDLLGYGNKPVPKAAAPEESLDARINPWRILKMVVPGRLQYAIKAMLPRAIQDWLLFRWYAGGQKWKDCRAFAIPNNDSVGAIRVSVKGRDLHGLVEPGDEYRRVCRDIADALYELTDPESGRPLVKRVTFAHELFEGPFLDQLPDLTVLWDQSFQWKSLRSPRIGTLRLRQQDGRTGGHSTRGLVLAMGPGIPSGAQLVGCSTYDIAPTVLEAAGVAVPPDMDGHPLPLCRVSELA
jgi:predicted AlkP superfamily phosphohydrolase/phosphomutase